MNLEQKRVNSAENELSDAQKDAIGEIANISMGTGGDNVVFAR